MRRLGNVFSPVRRLGFLLACREWNRILRTEYLVATGDLSAFESANRLAAYAGLVPAAHYSGKRKGNNHRMRGGNKLLKRVFH